MAGANVGSAVASAGDVNADGFDDLIVGAIYYEKGPQFDEGGAFVFLGSVTGLADLPVWSADPNQNSAFFGSSVSSAGDVNGDGFGDVIVGARLYDANNFDEGTARVYLGSASGLDPLPAWSVEGPETADQLGEAVSSAGDWNGDGYGDVVVSAPLHTNDETDEGIVQIYLGSVTGPAPTPASLAESNQIYPNFGFSVASAGDVNGDGLGDVIVGAPYFDDGQPDEGRAFVYHGRCVDIVDTDADTIGDACDQCPGSDDRIDLDSDGAADGCDVTRATRPCTRERPSSATARTTSVSAWCRSTKSTSTLMERGCARGSATTRTRSGTRERRKPATGTTTTATARSRRTSSTRTSTAWRCAAVTATMPSPDGAPH